MKNVKQQIPKSRTVSLGTTKTTSRGTNMRINSKTVVSKPLNSKAVVSKPLNSKAVVSKPLNSKTVVSKPLNSKTVVSKKIVSKNTTSKINTQKNIKKDYKERPKLGKNEEKCRSVLESIFIGHKFPSVRPDFLKNKKTNYNLELDCYSEKLQLALEYNGKQHYKRVSYFKMSKKDLDYQKWKDAYKNKVCKCRGIKLLNISYEVPYDQLEVYIIDKLANFIVKKYHNKEITLNDLNLSEYPQLLVKMGNILLKKKLEYKTY